MQPATPAHASRADLHMAITAATFRETGWEIAAPKVQCGTKIEFLGLDVATEGPDHPQGAIICPKAKRVGLLRLRDIAYQMDGREKARGPEVQQLVGRLGHMSRVAAEASLYLKGLYTASAWANTNKRGTRRKMITINGPGYAPTHYQDCLHWWKTARSSARSTCHSRFPPRSRNRAPRAVSRYLQTRHAGRAPEAEPSSPHPHGTVRFDSAQYCSGADSTGQRISGRA